MISVDYEEVAEKIVTKCMRIKEKKHLKKTRKFFLKWLDDIDGFISIDPYVDPRILSKLPEDKIGAQREGNRPINDKFIELGIRWTGIGFPTREKAEMFNIDFEEFWHLTSEKGTDLEFSIKGRKILVDDGIISDEDIKNKDVGNNLPCGEVFVAPIETSANGRAVFDLAFNRGNKITDIDVNFKNGKLSKIKAKENEKLLKDVIKNSQGNKDVIGELGIGINPEVRKAIGYTITDESSWREQDVRWKE
jgi:aminopeptidase